MNYNGAFYWNLLLRNRLDVLDIVGKKTISTGLQSMDILP